MQRSMLAVLVARGAALAVAGVLALALAACAQQQSSSSVTAPVASPAPAASASPGPQASATSPSPVETAPAPTPVATAAPGASPTTGPGPAPTTAGSAGAKGPGADLANVDPKFRPCHADAECIAVPRAGCCHNGWLEAVAATQKDAYAKANACTMTTRPVCPMYIVRDARVPKCDAPSHLCVLVQP